MKHRLWKRENKVASTALKTIGALVLIGTATALIRELPNLRRYLRIRQM